MRAIYKVTDTVFLGLHSLAVHKVRSALTALGIIFGVCGVIAMLAINEGVSEQSARALRELGSDNIIISSQKPPQNGASASGSGHGALVYGLTWKDVAQLKSNIPGIKRCVVVHATKKYAHVGDKSPPVVVLGTEPDYMRVARTEFTAGRNFVASDMLLQRPYCVITESLARRLFAYEDPIGQTMGLSGEPFVVIGVIARLPQAMAAEFGTSEDCVLIPLSTDRQRFGEYTAMRQQGSWTIEKVEVSQIILQMVDERHVRNGAKIADSLLQRNHKDRDFQPKIPLELLNQQKAQARLWNLMFLAIASVSLVVGGIGIMNIMLASITERTREIGIRRALGAKRTDIVVQFLVEAVALTTAGGLVGVLIGVFVPRLVEAKLGIMTVVSTTTLIVPFVMAVSVGLVSGIYPAYRAAKLDPIEALRHE